jgi:hypothetical protein
VVTCTFDAPHFERAIISGVPVSLTVCTLNNIPFVSVRFKFFILHCYTKSTLNMSLLFGAGFNSTKNMESGSLVLYYLMFQMFVTMSPSFSISVLISSGG